MTTGNPQLLEAAGRLDGWMREQAWPLWWRRGRHPSGAFFEALDFAGHPLASGESRVRVQARQLFSFLLAAKLGWRQPGLGDELAASAARFLGACFRADGLAGRVVDIERGALIDDRPDLYDNAFCLLALAHSRKALGASVADAAIGRLLQSLDQRLAGPNGEGYREFFPSPALQERNAPSSKAADSRTAAPSPGLRRQNPHMHLFESLLALYGQTGSGAVRQRAESLLNFISRRFFDLQGNFVREVAPSPEDSFEPGHSMEWVWLLGHRARLFGVELHRFALPLYQRAWAAAPVAGRTPLRLPCSRAPAAAPLPETPPGNRGSSDPSCRLWAQAETLKAHLCMVEHGPPEMAATAAQCAAQCAEAIGERWLSGTCPGGWVDHLDAHGRRIAGTMPASTGYHLYLAISELSRVAHLSGAPMPVP